MAISNKLSGTVACKRILYVLLFTLVFEGVIRKLVPGVVATAIFFIKDLLCIYGMFVVLNMKLDTVTKRLAAIWRKIFLAFVPLILYTFILDPPLGLFGTKQYLLYIVVCLLVPVAFDRDMKGLKRFIAIASSLIVPTTLVAILQNALPASHWLNKSVGGDDLGMFAAADKLRVSSTFSFTAQYSFFLNAVSAFFGASLFIRPHFIKISSKSYYTVFLSLVGLMLIIGAFITGGRTAVLGCGACLLLGFSLIGWRYPQWFVTKGIVGLVLVVFAFSTIRVAKPEYFAAYEARSSGSEEQTHSEEIEGRLINSFLGVGWLFDTDFSTMITGQGIGVMTNGSAQVSSYASQVRSTGFWTESDLASTIWEGGIYLVIIWYILRLYMIYYCYRNWVSIKSREYAFATSFFVAYVIVLGITGTLGIQAPIAIYWWMCIGFVTAIKKYDTYLQQKKVADATVETNVEAGNIQYEKTVSI